MLGRSWEVLLSVSVISTSKEGKISMPEIYKTRSNNGLPQVFHIFLHKAWCLVQKAPGDLLQPSHSWTGGRDVSWFWSGGSCFCGAGRMDLRHPDRWPRPPRDQPVPPISWLVCGHGLLAEEELSSLCLLHLCQKQPPVLIWPLSPDQKSGCGSLALQVFWIHLGRGPVSLATYYIIQACHSTVGTLRHPKRKRAISPQLRVSGASVSLHQPPLLWQVL